ncbi:MAG: pyrroline-5-carboxylate reductase [bacterium]
MRVGLLGSGKMAEAIASSLIQTGMCEPWDITACDISEDRRQLMAKQYQTVATNCPIETVRESEILIVAVKPQDLNELLVTLKPHLTKKHLLISIVAGKTLTFLTQHAGKTTRIIRVMPNLALMVQEGMSVYCASKQAKEQDKQCVAQIFGSAGAVLELQENHFDAVTALSGSGPAFIAYFLNAMIEGAIALKLPKDAARLLAEQTLIGAGIYLQNSGRDIQEFIQAIASPKGTTVAGLSVLEKSSLRSTMIKTLKAAADRSAELSKV